ncbi:predicted protein [Arabidopsis lyrata subsp. lyrata]|uniref:Predicted protein n=1 Tax=Arabidopsis lyrata subsp. lyrata TaxID=81972 RepID=D7L3F4_ARALL|nr:predicted protein [Arabidopsis lyrata subsp. lyrata]
MTTKAVAADPMDATGKLDKPNSNPNQTRTETKITDRRTTKTNRRTFNSTSRSERLTYSSEPESIRGGRRKSKKKMVCRKPTSSSNSGQRQPITPTQIPTKQGKILTTSQKTVETKREKQLLQRETSTGVVEATSHRSQAESTYSGG